MSTVLRDSEKDIGLTVEILDLSTKAVLLADELKGRGYKVSVPTPRAMCCGSSNERYLRNR